MKFSHLVLCSWIYSSVSWYIIYGNLNTICILLLCENCINLHYVKLVHGAFQVYYILLLFYICILLIFEDLILKSESEKWKPLSRVRLLATPRTTIQAMECLKIYVFSSIIPGTWWAPSICRLRLSLIAGKCSFNLFNNCLSSICSFSSSGTPLIC